MAQNKTTKACLWTSFDQRGKTKSLTQQGTQLKTEEKQRKKWKKTQRQNRTRWTLLSSGQWSEIEISSLFTLSPSSTLCHLRLHYILAVWKSSSSLNHVFLSSFHFMSFVLIVFWCLFFKCRTTYLHTYIAERGGSASLQKNLNSVFFLLVMRFFSSLFILITHCIILCSPNMSCCLVRSSSLN